MLNASCNDFEDIMVKRKILEKLKNSSKLFLKTKKSKFLNIL